MKSKSPPLKRQKLSKRTVNQNVIFLRALLESAPTKEGREFVLQDIYDAIKAEEIEAAEYQAALVKQAGEEEHEGPTATNEFHRLDELAFTTRIF
jgi:hypothetical protein